MRTSRRSGAVKPASLIRASVETMTGYTPGEQPAVPDIVKLNTNENPYPPSPKVAEALRRFDPVRLRLYPDPVSRKLREKIAELHGCRVEQVFACNGSDEVLALCTRAFVEDDGSIGYFNPSYSLYPVLADIRNVEKRPVELGPDFEWRMPSGYQCSLFMLTCPNAPTGIQYPERKVLEFCRRMKGVVVIDEAYVDFSRRNYLKMALRLPNVIVIRTFSKSFSLAGIRVGYAVGSERLIAALFKIKDSYNLNALSQTAAMAALSDMTYMRKTSCRIVASREQLAEKLRRRGFKVYPSETNFLWVLPPRCIAAEDLFLRLKERSVLARYFRGARTGDYLRITVGTPAQCAVLVKMIDSIL